MTTNEMLALASPAIAAAAMTLTAWWIYRRALSFTSNAKPASSDGRSGVLGETLADRLIIDEATHEVYLHLGTSGGSSSSPSRVGGSPRWPKRLRLLAKLNRRRHRGQSER